MPIAVDEKTFDYVLESDRGKPEAEQPTFVFKVLPVAKWRKVARINDAVMGMDNKEAEKMLDEMTGGLELALAGWRNMPTEYSIEALQDNLVVMELFELLAAAIAQNFIKEDKKKLESSPPSAPEQSVKDAPDATNAKTSPMKESESN